MKFFRRIVDFWLHAIFLTDSPQASLQDVSASADVISAGQDLQVAPPPIDSSDECVHGPLHRDCWIGGLNITTDYEQTWPMTGVTKNVMSTASI